MTAVLGGDVARRLLSDPRMATLVRQRLRVPWLDRHSRLLATIVALVVAMVALVLLMTRERADERSAVARVDPETRREIFTQTMHAARALCAQAERDRALSDRCIESAEFLLEFPECDEACVAFARAHRREATR